MNSDLKDHEENAISSTYSYTSRFFGNYLDNSQIDMSQSDIQKSSIDILDTSAHMLQLQGQGMQQLMHVRSCLVLRQYVYRWLKEKERLKREQMRSPAFMSKVLLKMCMLINVKAKTKCHFFFVRAKKVAKERQVVNINTNVSTKPSEQQLPAVVQPKEMKSPLNMHTNINMSKNTAEQQLPAVVEPKQLNSPPNMPSAVSQIPQSVLLSMKKQRNINSHIQIYQAFNKLSLIASNLHTKYFNSSLILTSFKQLQKIYMMRTKLQNIASMVSERQWLYIEFAWNQFHNWYNFTEKICIFIDQLKLLAHRQLRTAFLAIRHVPNSNLIEISRIHQKQTKHEVPMSTSTENIFAELQLVPPSRLQSKEQLLQHIASPFDLVTHDNHRQSNIQNNIEQAQFFLRNHPKNLKFSRDLKRKVNTVSSCLQAEDNQKNRLCEVDQQKYIPQYLKTDLNQSNNCRSRKESFNASFANNTSIVFKKTSINLPAHLLKNKRVLCSLNDNEMPSQMNDTAVNFCSISHSFRSRPNKTDDLQREITDFNDQFFIKDVMSYYLSICTQSNPRDYNMHGQYCTEQPTQMRKVPKTSRHLIETSIKSPFKKDTAKSTSRINFQSYQRTSTSKINTTQLKIPRSPPKFFDYYVQKPHTNRHFMQAKGTVKSLSYNRSNSFVSKRSPGPFATQKLPKKLFKTVKSGTKTALKSPQTYTPIITQTNMQRRQSKSKTATQAALKQSKHRQMLTNRGPSQQYLIQFGDPPKKKIKKLN